MQSVWVEGQLVSAAQQCITLACPCVFCCSRVSSKTLLSKSKDFISCMVEAALSVKVLVSQMMNVFQSTLKATLTISLLQ